MKNEQYDWTEEHGGQGSAYYFITEKVVDWCLAHPELLPHQADPTIAR